MGEVFSRLITHYDLPPVVFHSLRHSSITYKLKLNGGDIKSVQGDSGHAQAKMITDQYSHILDDSRKENAKLLEKAFYQKKEDQPDGNKAKETDSGSDFVPSQKISPKRIEGLLQNEKIIALLEKLADASGIDD